MSAQILVVDDDDDARGGLAEILSEEYESVIEAENGQEAIDLLRYGGVRPGLIVLDLRMPVMDGVAFLQHRAIDPSLGSAPVIVLTSETSILPDLVDAVAAVLPKPVPLTRLLEIIHALCDEPSRPGDRSRGLRTTTRRDAPPPGGVERRRRRLVA